MNRRAKPKITRHPKPIARSRSRNRAWGNPASHVVKRPWDFTKARHRGNHKNKVCAFTAFAVANLDMLRRRLLPREAQCVP